MIRFFSHRNRMVQSLPVDCIGCGANRLFSWSGRYWLCHTSCTMWHSYECEWKRHFGWCNFSGRHLLVTSMGIPSWHERETSYHFTHAIRVLCLGCVCVICWQCLHVSYVPFPHWIFVSVNGFVPLTSCCLARRLEISTQKTHKNQTSTH